MSALIFIGQILFVLSLAYLGWLWLETKLINPVKDKTAKARKFVQAARNRKPRRRARA